MANRRERNRTLLGAAIEQRDAYLRSAWEHDYAGALEDARKENVARLVDLLRAERVLTEPYFDDLEQFSLGLNRRDSQRLVNERFYPP